MTKSAKLKRLLAVVLAVGNFQNERTNSEPAVAFTLDSLLKLVTVRSKCTTISQNSVVINNFVILIVALILIKNSSVLVLV